MGTIIARDLWCDVTEALDAMIYTDKFIEKSGSDTCTVYVLFIS